MDASQPTSPRRTDIVVHELDGEALLFDPTTLSTHRLNETALFIWNLCDGLNSADVIAQKLSQRYDVTRDEAHDHVIRLLAEFERCALFEGQTGGPTTGTLSHGAGGRIR